MRRGLSFLAAILIVVACAEPDSSATTDLEVVTTAAPEPTTTTSTIALTTSTEATTTTLPEAIEREFGLVVPFTMTTPPDWQRAADSTQQVLYMEAGPNPILFAVAERETVEEWVDFLTTNPGLTATEPVPVEIGGAPGFTLEVRVGPEATEIGCQSLGPCAYIVTEGNGWYIVGGLPNQVWVVDVGGRAVLISAEASESSFEGFVARVEEALATLEWSEA